MSFHIRQSRLILTVLLILGSLSLWGESLRCYLEGVPAVVTDTTLTLDNPDQASDIGAFTTEARVAAEGIRERRGLSEGGWSLSVNGLSDTLRIFLRWGNSNYGDFTDRRYVIATGEVAGVCLFQTEAKGFAGAPGSYNSLRITLGADGTSLSVHGGSHAMAEIASALLPSPLCPVSSSVSVTGKGTVALLVNDYALSDEAIAGSSLTVDELESRLRATTDPLEGYWTYLDRQNDPAYARPGGRYTLATVSNGEGYDILYVDGAVTNAARWHPMMLKGSLTPTQYVGHFTLRWIDAEFQTITDDIHADLSDQGILSLSFPLLKTMLRFTKIKR